MSRCHRPATTPLTTACVWMLFTLAAPAEAGLTFFASFDKSPQADWATGNRQPSARSGDKMTPLSPTALGRFGRALDVRSTPESHSLRFDTAGNVNLARGTIEFFARVEPRPDGGVLHHYFNFTGDRGFNLALARRANGQGLVLSYHFNGEHKWHYYSERFIGLGQWHHYAVTWDTSDGPGKGTMAVYVDGTRRVHSTTISPFRFGLQHFYVGKDGSTHGLIDELAISDSVRYTQNFPSPRASLKAEAVKTLAREEGGNSPVRPKALPFGHASLANGSFEHWKLGMPVGWRLGSGEVRAETTMVMDGRRGLALYVDRHDRHPWPYSEIRSEPIQLEPHTRYRLKLWVSSASTVGDLKFVLSSFEEGDLVSYRSGWTTRHPWLEISETFTTGEGRQHTLSLGSQSAFGHPVWIDDIRIEPLGGNLSLKDDGDAGSLRVFSRSVMTSLDLPRQPPLESEIIDRLVIRLGRGEFEPGLVGIRAGRHTKDVDITLAGPLEGPGDSRLAASDITIRRLDSGMLPLSQPHTMRAGEVAGWWVTARTRDKTPPGLYRGVLKIASGPTHLRDLPLEVEVLDVVLPEPDIAFLMYHHEHYFPEQFLTPVLQKAYYRDMREHGMNTVTLYNNSDVDGSKNIRFDKNYSYKPGNPRFEVGLETQFNWILESGLCRSGQPVLWLPSGHGYGWGGLPEPALRETLKQWTARKWPKPLLYVNDEPGGEGERFDAAVKRLKEIRSWNLPVRTTTAGLDPKAIGKYYNVWIAGDAGVTMDAVSLSRELNAELWTYNCTCPHLNMPFSRAFYGFWAFRTGVRGVAQWAYYDNPHWTADEKGQVGGNPRTRLSRICPSPSGPIPTLSWEATREGIDDYRYAQRLRDLTATAETRLKTLQAEAKKWLDQEDRETIEARERQKIGQIKPKQKKIVWRPETPEEARGEASFLQARNLEAHVLRARQAMEYVVDTIPHDAMTTRIALSYHAPRWIRFSPPLGPAGLGDDPRTTTEVRRRILTSYILALQSTLEGKNAQPDTDKTTASKSTPESASFQTPPSRTPPSRTPPSRTKSSRAGD